MDFHRALILPCLTVLVPLAVAAPEPRFVEPLQRLGMVAKDKPVTVSFVIENPTDNLLEVISTETSCRCLEFQKGAEKLSANSKEAFTWEFSPARSEGLVEIQVFVTLGGGHDLTGKFQVWVEPPAGIAVSPPEPFTIFKPGDATATAAISLIGRAAVVEKAVIEFPSDVKALVVSDPLPVEGFPELRKTDYQLEAAITSGSPSREILICRLPNRSIEIPLSIESAP